jgi:nicotinamidase-related amidase
MLVLIKERLLLSIKPQRTILAVIDVENDFCSPSGAVARRGSDVAPCTAVARVAGVSGLHGLLPK